MSSSTRRVRRTSAIDDWARYVRLSEEYRRPAEVHELVGDAGKAFERLGWKPQVGFDELVSMMVEHDLDEQRHP